MGKRLDPDTCDEKEASNGVDGVLRGNIDMAAFALGLR